MMKCSDNYTFLELIPTPAFFINSKDRIICTNKRFLNEFGNASGEEYHHLLFNNKNMRFTKQTGFILSKKGRLFDLTISLYKSIDNGKVQLGILKDITEITELKGYIHYLEKLNREMSQIYHRQQKLIEKLSQQALTDGLTGLYNHRHFWERVNVELKRANRYTECLSCLMIDIDDFKHINDKFDHQFGDSILKKIAQILRTPLRETDILARYGGDEFGVLLPNTDYQGSQVISNKILERVRQSIFDIRGLSTTVTISLGVASYPVDNIIDSAQLVEYADAALYNAKARGKDQIVFFNDIKSFSLH